MRLFPTHCCLPLRRRCALRRRRTLPPPPPSSPALPADKAFKRLLKALNVSAEDLLKDKDLLTAVLSYHVIGTPVPSSALKIRQVSQPRQQASRACCMAERCWGACRMTERCWGACCKAARC